VWNHSRFATCGWRRRCAMDCAPKGRCLTATRGCLQSSFFAIYTKVSPSRNPHDTPSHQASRNVTNSDEPDLTAIAQLRIGHGRFCSRMTKLARMTLWAAPLKLLCDGEQHVRRFHRIPSQVNDDHVDFYRYTSGR